MIKLSAKKLLKVFPDVLNYSLLQKYVALNKESEGWFLLLIFRDPEV